MVVVVTCQSYKYAMFLSLQDLSSVSGSFAKTRYGQLTAFDVMCSEQNQVVLHLNWKSLAILFFILFLLIVHESELENLILTMYLETFGLCGICIVYLIIIFSNILLKFSFLMDVQIPPGTDWESCIDISEFNYGRTWRVLNTHTNLP